MEQTMPIESNGRPPIERLAYTVSEAAEALEVSEATIYRLIVRGALRSPKKLRHKRILKSDLERFLQAEELPVRRQTQRT